MTGEGEVSIQLLVDYLCGKTEWETVKGVGKVLNNQYSYNGNPEMVVDLDSLPFVARHLTPYKKYNSILTKGDVVTTLFTSRGCPYKCSFCDRPQLRPNFRARSAKNVVDEMEHCVNLGINEFIIAVGYKAEIRFFEFTDGGLPRFPIYMGYRLDR